MRVSALYRHPIKSTAAHVLVRARLDAFGFEHDRRMMLVDDKGRFVTARSHPQLARCTTTKSDSGWRVEHPTHGRVEFSSELGELREVEVWGDRFMARELEASAGTWFSELLGTPLQLVSQAPESQRPVDPEYTPNPERDETVFADGFPVLITTRASLDALNKALESPVDMLRFRPNIVVDGELAWDEDDWLELQVGELPFACTKPCVRCSMTGVEPQTGERAPEPLRTLGKLRADVSFGMNLVHLSEGEIAVGDPVHVSRRRSG